MYIMIQSWIWSDVSPWKRRRLAYGIWEYRQIPIGRCTTRRIIPLQSRGFWLLRDINETACVLCICWIYTHVAPMHAHAKSNARCGHENGYELFDPALETKLTMDCENYVRLLSSTCPAISLLLSIDKRITLFPH